MNALDLHVLLVSAEAQRTIKCEERAEIRAELEKNEKELEARGGRMNDRARDCVVDIIKKAKVRLKENDEDFLLLDFQIEGLKDVMKKLGEG